MSCTINFEDLIKSLETAKSDLDLLDTKIESEFMLINGHREAIDLAYANLGKLEAKRSALMRVVSAVSMAMARTIEENRQQTTLAYHYAQIEEAASVINEPVIQAIA